MISPTSIFFFYCASCTLAFPLGTHIATFKKKNLNQVGMIQICPVVLLEHFNLMEGGDQTSKKHEAYCGSKRDSYQNHIEELPKYGPLSHVHLGSC